MLQLAEFDVASALSSCFSSPGPEILIDGEHGDIEGTATQIEDENARRLVLVQAIETVRQRSGSRLVDDAQDIEAGDATSGLGSSALGVVEVRRNGDDRLNKEKKNKSNRDE